MLLYMPAFCNLLNGLRLQFWAPTIVSVATQIIGLWFLEESTSSTMFVFIVSRADVCAKRSHQCCWSGRLRR